MSGVERCWQAAGRPDPNWAGRSKSATAAPRSRDGICALTGQVGTVVEPGAILSDLFTTWDRLPWRLAPGAGLSFAAAWAFKERAHQMQPHGLIDGTWGPLDPPSLFAALSSLPHSTGDIITVPQSRQKHLVPFCVAGHVRVDDETLSWDVLDVKRLEMVARLRELGFGEAALAEPAPRWVVMARTAISDQSFVLAAWDALRPWRTHPAYLDVACRATRAPKETPDA